MTLLPLRDLMSKCGNSRDEISSHWAHINLLFIINTMLSYSYLSLNL